jgi:hypothetical protein
MCCRVRPEFFKNQEARTLYGSTRITWEYGIQCLGTLLGWLIYDRLLTRKPRSTDPVRFHQNYMGKWHTVLGDAPSLVDLRSFTHEFLTTKCAPDKVAEANGQPEASLQ